MVDNSHQHVLFKDLRNYMKCEDYLEGYTPLEQSWIRKNLGIEERSQTDAIEQKTHEQIVNLINNNELKPGLLYTIKYLDNYQIIALAYSNKDFAKNVVMITDDPHCSLWDVKYDFDQNEVIYLKDENGNEANFDFKNIKMNIFDKEVYLFQDEDGNENSKNCKCNNLLNSENISFTGNSSYNIIQGNNVIFNTPINHLNGEIKNIEVNSNLSELSDNNIKYIINTNDKSYIEYTDLQTLTKKLHELV